MSNKLDTRAAAAELTHGARRWALKSIVGKIGQGLYFMKALALYGRPSGRPAKNCFTRDSVSDLDENAAPEGFRQWLQEAFLEAPVSVSVATAYRYIRMARRLGFNEDSTDDQLLALDAAGALAGKTVRGLCEPENPSPEERAARHKQPPPPPEQLFLAFEHEIDSLLTPESPYQRSLPLMPLASLDVMETKLRTALDLVKEAKASAARGARKEAK